MTRRDLSAVIALLVWGAALPGVASASTVSVDRGLFSSELRFTASPGERNQVTVEVAHPARASGDSTWTFRDDGAPLTPGVGCVAVEERAVRCVGRVTDLGATLDDMDDDFRFTRPADGRRFPLSWVVIGGKGNDRIAGNASDASIYGGAGDDYLASEVTVAQPDAAPPGQLLDGGPGNDQVLGGAGKDELNGGGGVDELNGRAGTDYLRDGDDVRGGPGPDVMVGGGGSDWVDYGWRSSGVRVDLADPNATAGEAGEGDRVIEVENVLAGGGNDVLAGDDGPNWLDGQGGRDRLIGRGGDDLLSPQGLGHRAGPGEGGRISCGPGVDRFPSGVSLRHFLEPDCEIVAHKVTGTRLFSAYPVAVHGGRLHYRVRCPQLRRGEHYLDQFDPAPCSGAVRLEQATGRGRLLARGAFSRGRWRDHTVTAALTARGRRLARRPNGVRAHVVLRVRPIQSSGPRPFTMRWTVRLRLPAPAGVSRRSREAL